MTFVDIHILQTVPPSCINRDDTGSPKTAVYGGVTRARVSSQSWKAATRKAFHEFGEEFTGIRTKKVHTLLKEEIEKKIPGKGDALAEKILKAIGLSVKAEKGKEDKKLESLFFISKGQIDALAEVAEAAEKEIISDKELKNRVKEAMVKTPSKDILLFGRMVAADPSLNFDAACQVAHAISTHAVQTEFDFFTAIDDCAEPGEGAAHLDSAELSSSTLYRYATVNLNELKKYLSSEETAKTTTAFVKAFSLSMPTGKQNSFANRTLPDLIYVTLQDDQPVNFAGAFEKPVRSTSEGYVTNSKVALREYAEHIYEEYADAPKKAYFTGLDQEFLGEKKKFPDLLEALQQELSEVV